MVIVILNLKVICTLSGTEMDMETRGGGCKGPRILARGATSNSMMDGKLGKFVQGESICFGGLGDRCRKTVRMVTSQVLARRTKEIYLYRVG